MFDIFPKALSSVASFLFPLFASYKALKTSDPAQLTPWLMYWVVLACVLLVESWAEFVLVWIPFYAYLRLLFLLYLVLPQTQGARIIYQTRIHPWLEENESAIEDFIASAHDRLKAAGIAYLKRAIELLKTNVLGLPPDEPAQGEAVAAAAGATPQSYTTALLARFSLPSARWSGGGAGAAGADFYNLLASAVSAATGGGAAAGAAGMDTGTAATTGGADAAATAGTLIPPTIRGPGEKMSFIAAQLERLRIVMSALDREADEIAQGEAARRRAREARRAAGSLSLDGEEDDEEDDEDDGGMSRPRPTGSGLPGLGMLSKSRSEADFEKIEAESGAEDGGARSGGSRRTQPAGASGLSSWIPWGWGGGGEGAEGAEDAEVAEGGADADTAVTSGYEK